MDKMDRPWDNHTTILDLINGHLNIGIYIWWKESKSFWCHLVKNKDKGIVFRGSAKFLQHAWKEPKLINTTVDSYFSLCADKQAV